MRTIIFIIGCLFAGVQSFVYAQDIVLEALPIHKNEKGVVFTLAFNGAGVGGFIRKALPGYLLVGSELDFLVIRDDKEIRYETYQGERIRVNAENRLFLMPLNIELKKRLFVDDIEDEFRPHILGQAGGMFGMNFPLESRDKTHSPKIKRENEYRFSYNWVLGIGTDILVRENTLFTIRAQVRQAFFPVAIAGKEKFSTFEIKFEMVRF